MQYYENMSNTELLALLIGKRNANSIKKKTLLEIFNFQNPNPNGVSDGSSVCYQAHPALYAAKELLARCFLEVMKSGVEMDSPGVASKFLCSKIGTLEYEVFWCLWLNNQNQLIISEQLFRGTLSQASVYPREVVKKGLSHNAAAVIFAHNHPSGVVKPSRADISLTQTLKSTLNLVDIRVIDHLVISGTNHYSFAENGSI